MFEFNAAGCLPEASIIEKAYLQLMITHQDNVEEAIRLVGIIYKESEGKNYECIKFEDGIVLFRYGDSYSIRICEIVELGFIRF